MKLTYKNTVVAGKRCLQSFKDFVGVVLCICHELRILHPHFFDVAIVRNIKFLTCLKNLVETNGGELFLQDYCSSGDPTFFRLERKIIYFCLYIRGQFTPRRVSFDHTIFLWYIIHRILIINSKLISSSNIPLFFNYVRMKYNYLENIF